MIARNLGRRFFGSSSALPAAASRSETTLNDILLRKKQKPVTMVEEDTKNGEAMKMMETYKSSTLIVHKNSVPIGLVGERDILHADVEEPVSELMVQPTTGLPTTTIREALQLLDDSKQDNLPIVTQGNSINGMISAKDIIGQYYFDLVGQHDVSLDEKTRLALEEDALKCVSLPSVKDILKAKKKRNAELGDWGTMLLNLHVEDAITVSEVLEQMLKFEKGSVVVLDDVRDKAMLTGIVTEQDIIRKVFAKDLDIEKTLVTDIMTSSKDRKLETVSTKDSVLTCALKMMTHNLRHLPVVAYPRSESIYGMISSKDVVSYLRRSFDEPTN